MTIRLTSRARKDIRKLSPRNLERVRSAVLSLADDPQRGIPLAGGWAGYRRLRVGDYRIIYRIHDEGEIVVHYVRSRGAAYR
ncbi:MAG: type II toxin-antitoxin system RelE/ParE family toxin [Candidatus Bipolaricaulota bacterium]